MDWWTHFPAMDDASLTAFKKAIDEAFREFTRSYGESIEMFFQPLQFLLIQAEQLMTQTPWPIVLIADRADRLVRQPQLEDRRLAASSRFC